MRKAEKSKEETFTLALPNLFQARVKTFALALPNLFQARV
jgi:hypothetical protein